jgi:hypothetical protein
MAIPKMVDEYRILQDALNTLRYAQLLESRNQELYDHLCGSIIYLLKYSEKYNLPLPNMEGLRDMIVRSHEYIRYIKEMQRPPTESQQRKETPDKDDSTIDFNFQRLSC